MMSIMFLVLIISANCVNVNCEEDPGTTEKLNAVVEKPESFSADPEELKSKTGIDDNASEVSEDSEDIRVSRSSSEHSLEDETRSNDAIKSQSTEASLTEKSASEEVINEAQDQESDKVVELITGRASSAAEEDNKSSENVEKQLEELPEISRSASETEDRKAEDLSEASSESKLSDNEKASSNVNINDRKSEIEEVNENSKESDLNESRDTRRMFSAPSNIVVDVKMGAETISTTVEPEVKTALNQNLNTYNNLNEFGTDSDSKLTDSSRTEPSHITAKTNTPDLSKFAVQEIFNQRYLPKFYPRPELGIHFPNVNSDFQGPRDLPVYLKVKQDEYQSQNHFTDSQILQFKSAQENTYFNSNNQQQFNQPHRQAQDKTSHKHYENLQIEPRIQTPKQNQNQVATNVRSFIENKQLANLNQGSQNPSQQLYQNQEKINRNYKNFAEINHEIRNGEIEGKPKMPINANHHGNQYRTFRQPQEIIESRINLDKKQFEVDRLGNPYPNVPHHLQAPNSQQVIAPKNQADIIPKNIQMLFQKLASASLLPAKLSTNLYSTNNIQNYPPFINADFTAAIPFYDFHYNIPGCC